MLNNSVQTSFRTFAIFVALINAGDHNLIQPPELITNILVDFVLPIASCVLNRQLPASTPGQLDILIIEIEINIRQRILRETAPAQ